MCDTMPPNDKLFNGKEANFAIPKTFTKYLEINGHATNLCLSIFSNHLFAVVTQIDTFGTVIEARYQHSQTQKKQADIHVRLGRRDDPLLLVYARQFLERFGAPMDLPIVLAVGLKDRSSDTFEKIMNEMHSLLNGDKQYT